MKSKLPPPFDSIPDFLWNVLFTNFPVGLCLVSQELEIIQTNERFASLLSRPSSFITGQSLHTFVRRVHMAQTVLLAESVRSGVLGGFRQVIALEYDETLKPVWVELSVQGVFQGDAFVCYLVSAFESKGVAVLPDAPKSGAKQWLADNWSKLTPIVLALATLLGTTALAAIKFYAKWQEITHHVEKLDNQKQKQ